ncbi:purine-binding chemotaxis protein CheW [Caldicellulosiruptor bescii]|uniref:CheW protein n=2 Tax=Caldicellulosiruptor bescii TaxID=31899 RepID=B9MM00_CALBD|nr:chemotaxis protein CheW [Caldicellulosiruptor bescii]ACM61223.1 CheW protein [Caldicellulosiruptor bescii DSM 6725]PBC88964.1 purine-binding chemotaxis protein CheW [Caldicellulosiruptor bescii]PBC91554.1 purine-binding chemotaxis protein CheW [Caldicellulosiruptor bescii]PBD03033.1 purine-binding chemotaxis protein CheW [Caldicellulosiruptor bescii]PBD07352.1 purine-binding chemotaxis protein CheW [Caldicellulosiruptor bescii]
MEQYLVFRLADEHYGLNVNNIENIEKLMPITRVPHTKQYVKGVINLRGEIVPVIDLREKIGVEKEEFGEETRILIVNWKGEFKVGLIIDEVLDVVYLSKEDFDQATRDRNEFKFSIAKYNGMLINIINLEDVLFEKAEEV